MSNVKLIHPPTGRKCEVPADSAGPYITAGWEKSPQQKAAETKKSTDAKSD